MNHKFPNLGTPMDSINKRQPNAETIAAMREAERIAKDPNAKSYSDVAELFKDLES